MKFMATFNNMRRLVIDTNDHAWNKRSLRSGIQLMDQLEQPFEVQNNTGRNGVIRLYKHEDGAKYPEAREALIDTSK